MADGEDMAMLDEEAKTEEMEDLSNYVTVDGIIIKQDFDHLIMEENEVDKYTPLQSATMEQILYVPFQHDIQVLGYFLHSYYAQVDVEFPKHEDPEEGQNDGQKPQKYDIKFLIEGQIEVLYFRKKELLQV